MSNANDGHVTHPMTSQNKEWRQWCAEIDQYVEEHYAKVMSPYQRDMVKRIAYGNEKIITARPFIHRICSRTAREVVAVLTEKRRSGA